MAKTHLTTEEKAMLGYHPNSKLVSLTPTNERELNAMGKINEKADELLISIITERIRTETKLFHNLAICETNISSLKASFSNTTLTMFSMLEYTDRIEKCEKTKALIRRLIEFKTKEWMLEKSTGDAVREAKKSTV